MTNAGRENFSVLSEREQIGRFLIYAYHKRVFSSSDNGKVVKRDICIELRRYLEEKKITHLVAERNVELLLTRYNFVRPQIQTPRLLRIDLKNFFEFRNEIIKKMDQQQMQQKHYKQISENKNSGNDNTEEFKQLEVDPDVLPCCLDYQNGAQVKTDLSFIPSSKACEVCQINYRTEHDYQKHIATHGPETDFMFLRSELFKKNYSRKLDIFYTICKDSYFLALDLRNDSSHVIMIDKILVVRSNSMINIIDDKQSKEISPGETNRFFADCHSFDVGYEHALLMIFHVKDQTLTRYIEQHNLQRYDPFPMTSMRLKTNRIIERGILKLGKIKEYYPSGNIQNMLKNMSDEAIRELNPHMRGYIENGKVLTSSNYESIFEFLVELEDSTILENYRRLTQFNKKIRTICGRDYALQLESVKGFKTEDILSEGDQIILNKSKQEDTNPSKNETNQRGKQIFYSRIKKINGKTVYFTAERIIPDSFQYNISFKPARLQIIFQREVLQRYRDKKFLSKLLFPTIEQLPKKNGQPKIPLNLYNKRVRENPEQMQAIVNILAEIIHPVPYVIFGPPGTGKTTTVVESIIQLWQADPRNVMLVTAGSNAACDEVASRLCKYFNGNDIVSEKRNLVRIYAAAVEKRLDQLDENLVESSNLAHGYHFYPPLDTIYLYRIVVCTLTVSGKLLQANMSNTHFTHIFIDECGASTEPETLIPIAGLMSASCRLILAGDPKQLGPILTSEKADELGLGKSILERLLDRECYKTNHPTILTRLVRNFRTHPHILQMSNTLYYENSLIPCAAKELTNWACGWHRLPNKNFPMIFQSVIGKTESERNATSLCNYAEVATVMDFVRDIMFFGINGRVMEETDIGVISPYKRQCNILRAELDKRYWFKIETGSVETFQGKEKPIIIMSMVRSNTNTVGFLKNPKRLNVSLTRPQALLIIVGNPETLQKFEDWQYVIAYCREKRAFTGRKFNLDDKTDDNRFKNSSTEGVSSVTAALSGTHLDVPKGNKEDMGYPKQVGKTKQQISELNERKKGTSKISANQNATGSVTLKNTLDMDRRTNATECSSSILALSNPKKAEKQQVVTISKVFPERDQKLIVSQMLKEAVPLSANTPKNSSHSSSILEARATLPTRINSAQISSSCKISLYPNIESEKSAVPLDSDYHLKSLKTSTNEKMPSGVISDNKNSTRYIGQPTTSPSRNFFTDKIVTGHKNCSEIYPYRTIIESEAWRSQVHQYGSEAHVRQSRSLPITVVTKEKNISVEQNHKLCNIL